MAFADDVAVLTYPSGISNMFRNYNRFSEASGLYLNVDKTEILPLKQSDEEKNFKVSDGNSKTTIVFGNA